MVDIDVKKLEFLVEVITREEESSLEMYDCCDVERKSEDS